MIGEQSELGRVPGGYFADGQPMATHAGLEVLTRPRDLAAGEATGGRRRDIAAKRWCCCRPAIGPVYSQVSHVARELFQKLGLTVDFQPMDWGSVVTRRTSQNPTDKGGWSAFITAWTGDSQQSRRQLRVAGQRPESLVRLADR